MLYGLDAFCLMNWTYYLLCIWSEGQPINPRMRSVVCYGIFSAVFISKSPESTLWRAWNRNTSHHELWHLSSRYYSINEESGELTSMNVPRDCLAFGLQDTCWVCYHVAKRGIDKWCCICSTLSSIDWGAIVWRCGSSVSIVAVECCATRQFFHAGGLTKKREKRRGKRKEKIAQREARA